MSCRTAGGALRVLLLVVLVDGAVARAQPADPARAAFVAGTRLYRAGQYAAALARFREAHRALPSPKILFNIASCEAALGEHAAAARDYTRVLRDPARLGPSEREHAHRMLAQLRPKVGWLAVTAPAECEIRVGADRFEAGGELIPVTPGAHDVVLWCRDRMVASRAVTVAPGEQSTVMLEPLAPAPPRPSPTAPRSPLAGPPPGGVPSRGPPVGSPPSAPAPPGPSGARRALPFIVGGAGVVLIGVGAALYVLAGADHDAKLAATTQPAFDDAKSAGKLKEGIGVALLAVGGVAVAGGVGLWLLARRGPAERRTARLTPWLTTGGGGVLALGCF